MWRNDPRVAARDEARDARAASGRFAPAGDVGRQARPGVELSVACLARSRPDEIAFSRGAMGVLKCDF